MSNVLTGVTGAFSGLISGLESLGVSATNIPAALSSIFSSLNPNQSAELAICTQIMQEYDTPQLVLPLVNKLVIEQGIPEAAAKLALTLPTTPSAQIPGLVLTIESIIKNGG